MRGRAHEHWQLDSMAGYTGPMTTTEQILAAALGLPAEERVRLVDALVQSLDDDDSPITEVEREVLDHRLRRTIAILRPGLPGRT
jgi:hypothetical protein